MLLEVEALLLSCCRLSFLAEDGECGSFAPAGSELTACASLRPELAAGVALSLRESFCLIISALLLDAVRSGSVLRLSPDAADSRRELNIELGCCFLEGEAGADTVPRVCCFTI